MQSHQMPDTKALIQSHLYESYSINRSERCRKQMKHVSLRLPHIYLLKLMKLYISDEIYRLQIMFNNAAFKFQKKYAAKLRDT